MKKFTIVSIAYALLITVSSLSAFDAHRTNPIDIRSISLGGSHLADTEHFYALYNNPAAIIFTQDKKMLPAFSSILSGPLAIIPDLTPLFKDQSEATIEAALGPVLNSVGSQGLNIGLELGGLCTFGSIKNLKMGTLGVGLMDKTYTDVRVLSLTRSTLKLGVNTGAQVAYALPIDFAEAGTLSVGLAGHVTYQVQAKYSDAPAGIISVLNNVNTLPMYQMIGIGFDVGVQHKIGMLHSALVWKDIISPLFVTEYTGFDSYKGRTGTRLDTTKINSQLGVGVEVDIPLKEKTLGIITACRVYTDYNDFIPLFNKNIIARNPLLELAFGTEIELINVFAFRLGIHESYPSAGLGLTLNKFRLNVAMYGSELSFEPGLKPQLNVALSSLITY
ncbi:MAG TPA: hypothetical protein VFC68_06445 [Treponemataceae bacterium]|nr:hypothetical protein [Treponemataceae bacterium]